MKESLGIEDRNNYKITDKNSELFKFISDSEAVKHLNVLIRHTGIEKLDQGKSQNLGLLVQSCDLETLEKMSELGKKLSESHLENGKSTSLTPLECIVVGLTALLGIIPGVLAYIAFKGKHVEEVKNQENREFIEASHKFQEVSGEIQNIIDNGPKIPKKWIEDIASKSGRNPFAMGDLGQGPKGDHPIKSFAEKVMQSREAAKNDHDHTH